MSTVSQNKVNVPLLLLSPAAGIIDAGVKAVKSAAASNVSLPQDTASVSTSAPKSNPFESIGAKATTVTVEPWKSGENNPNSTISGMLLNSGYTQEELYAKDDSGKTLIDRVASANKLKNPNVIHPGQELVIPSKGEAEASSESSSGNYWVDAWNDLTGQYTAGSNESAGPDSLEKADASSSSKSSSRATSKRLSMDEVKTTISESPFMGSVINDDRKFDREQIARFKSGGTVSDKELAEQVANGTFSSIDEARDAAKKFGQAMGQFSEDGVALNALESQIFSSRIDDYAPKFNLEHVERAQDFSKEASVKDLNTIAENVTALDSLSGSAHRGNASGDGVSVRDLRNAGSLLESATYRQWINSGQEGGGWGGTKSDMLRDFLQHIPMNEDEIGNPQAYRQRVHGVLSAAARVSQDDSTISILQGIRTERNGAPWIIRRSDLESLLAG